MQWNGGVVGVESYDLMLLKLDIFSTFLTRVIESHKSSLSCQRLLHDLLLRFYAV